MSNFFKPLLSRLHHDQKGATLTEFVLFLPIWITVFAGVINLGKIGMESTKIQMIAQQKMWSMAIDTGTSDISDDWALPGVAGKDAASVAIDLNRGVGDLAEFAASGFQAASGHWGESFSLTTPIDLLTNSVSDLTLLPKDIIGDAAFPNAIVNDNALATVADLTSDDSFSVKGVLRKLVSGSGVVVSYGAGIRYGMAYGRHSDSIALLRQTSIEADFHFDVIAAPSPVEGKFQPFAVARLMAELDESNNYSKMMNFGQRGWKVSGSKDGANDFGIDTDFNKKIEKEKKKAEKQKKKAEKKRKKECARDPDQELCHK